MEQLDNANYRDGVDQIDDLREELSMQICMIGILVKSRRRYMVWAGHVERMNVDRLPRMAYAHKEYEQNDYRLVTSSRV